MTDLHIFLTLAVIALVTAITRFLPFVIFTGGKKTPRLVEKLGRLLPFAIMGMLVVYCLRSVSFADMGTWFPALLSVIVVSAVYVWRKNTLASIIAGTVCYMILVQKFF